MTDGCLDHEWALVVCDGVTAVIYRCLEALGFRIINNVSAVARARGGRFFAQYLACFTVVLMNLDDVVAGSFQVVVFRAEFCSVYPPASTARGGVGLWGDLGAVCRRIGSAVLRLGIWM
jgi:hypothetical protein